MSQVDLRDLRKKNKIKIKRALKFNILIKLKCMVENYIKVL